MYAVPLPSLHNHERQHRFLDSPGLSKLCRIPRSIIGNQTDSLSHLAHDYDLIKPCSPASPLRGPGIQQSLNYITDALASLTLDHRPETGSTSYKQSSDGSRELSSESLRAIWDKSYDSFGDVTNCGTSSEVKLMDVLGRDSTGFASAFGSPLSEHPFASELSSGLTSQFPGSVTRESTQGSTFGSIGSPAHSAVSSQYRRDSWCSKSWSPVSAQIRQCWDLPSTKPMKDGDLAQSSDSFSDQDFVQTMKCPAVQGSLIQEHDSKSPYFSTSACHQSYSSESLVSIEENASSTASLSSHLTFRKNSGFTTTTVDDLEDLDLSPCISDRSDLSTPNRLHNNGLAAHVVMPSCLATSSSLLDALKGTVSAEKLSSWTVEATSPRHLPRNLHYYVIKSFSLEDIQQAVVNSVWASTPRGNDNLENAWNTAQACGANVILFFSVNGSGQFCAAGQLLSGLYSEDKQWLGGKGRWRGHFKVKFHYLRDVPNAFLKNFKVTLNSGKSVTQSRDTQELDRVCGEKVLKVFQTMQFGK